VLLGEKKAKILQNFLVGFCFFEYLAAALSCGIVTAA
jgi:hypothetical protein